MDKFVLRSQKIPFWLELGLFNFVALAVMLPVVWFQFLGQTCWLLSYCGCSNTVELFYRGNLRRLELLALGLPVLVLAECLLLHVWADRILPKSPSLWLEYAGKNVFRSLPFVLLVLAVMALPEARPAYALFAMLGIWTMFGAEGINLQLSPVAMLRSQACLPPRLHLKHILIYLALLGSVVPVLFFSRAFACQDRAKSSSVKANMHTFQTIVETYAVDWGGVYASDVQQLRSEATSLGKEYWKEFTNPYTSLSGEGKSYATMPADLEALLARPETRAILMEPYKDIMGIRLYKPDYLQFENPSRAGWVLYDSAGPTRYYLYGLDHNGLFIRDKGKSFYLSNS